MKNLIKKSILDVNINNQIDIVNCHLIEIDDDSENIADCKDNNNANQNHSNTLVSFLSVARSFTWDRVCPKNIDSIKVCAMKLQSNF